MSARVLLPVLVVLALLGGLVVDAVVADPGLPDQPAPPEALAAGSSTCAALGTAGGARTTAFALTGPVPTALTGVDESAGLSVEQEGSVRVAEPLAADGELDVVPVADGLDAPLLAARWRTAPLVLSRSWTRPAADLVDPTLVEGPCPRQAGTTWYVPGLATAGGAAATLHLANPFDGTASASVRFTTASGPVAPTRLRNVVVPAHGTVQLELGTFAPEEPDLGVVVDVEVGRVVAEAVQALQPAIGGVAGATHVVAHAAPAEVWTVPHVAVGERTSSWVWVTNPGETGADVRLVVHTAAGPSVPPDGGLLVAPGTTERVDLGQLLLPGEPAAVTVRSSEGAPVVVSGAVVRSDEDPTRSGLAVVAGVPALGDEAPGSTSAQVAAGLGGAGRTGLVAVTNPGTAPATVDVAVDTTTGPRPVPGGTGLAVPPGATVALALTAALAGPHAVVVTPTSGAVVAALVTQTGGEVLPASGDGDAGDGDAGDGDGSDGADAGADGDGAVEDDGPPSLALVVTTAVAFPTLADSTPLVGVLEPTLLTRTGTPLGPSPAPPGPGPAPQPDEVPSEPGAGP